MLSPLGSRSASLALLALLASGLTAAADVPATLPKPDGKPGDATKPVQVYILAGQSNMIGFGAVSGAAPRYSAEYLTSDPAAPAGVLNVWRVGEYKIGRCAVFKADGTQTDEPLAAGLLEVPMKGVYRIHCGHGATATCTMTIDGKEVYRREAGGPPVLTDVTLEPGKRVPFAITGAASQAPRFWMQKTDLQGNGDLEKVVRRDGKFPWIDGTDGTWAIRNDVTVVEARDVPADKLTGRPLQPGCGVRPNFGPELGFGHVMGTFHDGQVLVIKTAMGNRSLDWDFRPPSSGRTDRPDAEKWEGLEYRLTVEGVRTALASIDKLVPGYAGQGFEMAGFFWFQGHKDKDSTKEAYEKNLVNLIADLRKEFEAPKLPVVVATVAFDGPRLLAGPWRGVWEAQMAVGDAQQHPELAGTVASVDARTFWRERDESPTGQDYHYNWNAETYTLVGDTAGRAMVGLRGGTAEPLPQPPRAAVEPAPVIDVAALSPAQNQALAPIVIDGIGADFAANPGRRTALEAQMRGDRPERPNQLLGDTIDDLAMIYRNVGIHDYDWHVFGKDLRDLEWEVFSFDPPETLPKEKWGRYRTVTLPAGMEEWFASGFDAAKAGWKKGLPPFGHLDGKPEAYGKCARGVCGCGENPRTPWEKEVILARGTFDLPPAQPGHRYRIVVGGSAHVNAGEGYAIFVNGRPFAESPVGIGVGGGGQARGGHVHADFRDDFKGGPVTIAVTSFLQTANPRGLVPPRGHLTVWVEEQKLPPLP
ncbi:MAG: sialate O-acetylesterase [Planctomycetaceae bacterium]